MAARWEMCLQGAKQRVFDAWEILDLGEIIVLCDEAIAYLNDKTCNESNLSQRKSSWFILVQVTKTVKLV